MHVILIFSAYTVYSFNNRHYGLLSGSSNTARIAVAIATGQMVRNSHHGSSSVARLSVCRDLEASRRDTAIRGHL